MGRTGVVGLVCGGGVHQGDTSTVFMWGNSIHIAMVLDMTTYLCVGFSSLASLMLCFSPAEAKVRLVAD